jgi:hypothetical protein
MTPLQRLLGLTENLPDKFVWNIRSVNLFSFDKEKAARH